MPRHFIINLLLALFALAGGCANQSPSQLSAMPVAKGFSIVILSRGQGVPALAKEKLKQIESLLKPYDDRGELKVSKSRIGLEGETKVCVTVSDSKITGQLLSQIQAMAKGVDLMNVTAEPCDPRY